MDASPAVRRESVSCPSMASPSSCFFSFFVLALLDPDLALEDLPPFFSVPAEPSSPES